MPHATANRLPIPPSRLRALLAAGLVALAGLVPVLAQPADEDVVATFSIVAFDPETKDLGVAVASRVLAVGAVVPWAKAGVGAVATQAWADPTFGPRGLDLMAAGAAPADALASLLEPDRQRERRQVALVDATGRVAAHTGDGAMAWAGSRTGEHYSCQGNILAGEDVVAAMAKAYEATDGELAVRLMAALAAGDEAGGDRRGRQSAAILVVREGAGYGGGNDRYVDLRVDDHAEPVAELGRIVALRLGPEIVRRAYRLLRRGDREAAGALVDQAREIGGRSAITLYMIASYEALTGETEAAVATLGHAIELRADLAEAAASERAFEGLRDDPAFRRLVGLPLEEDPGDEEGDDDDSGDDDDDGGEER